MSPDEASYRSAIFYENVEYIEELQKKIKGNVKLGLNQFSLMTE